MTDKLRDVLLDLAAELEIEETFDGDEFVWSIKRVSQEKIDRLFKLAGLKTDYESTPLNTLDRIVEEEG